LSKGLKSRTVGWLQIQKSSYSMFKKFSNMPSSISLTLHKTSWPMQEATKDAAEKAARLVFAYAAANGMIREEKVFFLIGGGGEQ
jgi:hypothetical protein